VVQDTVTKVCGLIAAKGFNPALFYVYRVSDNEISVWPRGGGRVRVHAAGLDRRPPDHNQVADMSSWAPTPAATWEPFHEVMLDRLSPEKRERTWLLMCAFIQKHQGSEHLARVVPELAAAGVWEDPPRWEGPKTAADYASEVLPSRPRDATVV